MLKIIKTKAHCEGTINEMALDKVRSSKTPMNP